MPAILSSTPAGRLEIPVRDPPAPRSTFGASSMIGSITLRPLIGKRDLDDPAVLLRTDPLHALVGKAVDHLGNAGRAQAVGLGKLADRQGPDL